MNPNKLGYDKKSYRSQALNLNAIKSTNSAMIAVNTINTAAKVAVYRPS